MNKIVELKIEQIANVVGGLLAVPTSTSLNPAGTTGTVSAPAPTTTTSSQLIKRY